MIITNTAKNTMPEQVQENMDNIVLLQEQINQISAGKLKGRNLWTNPAPTQSCEAIVIPSAEFLEPYNSIKLYFINQKDALKLSITTIVVDLDVNYPTNVFFHNGSHFAKREIEFNSLQNEISISTDKITDVLTGIEEDGEGDCLIPLAAIGFIEDVRL